jgi:alpha-beta hydrolase superfamily lysophospholipase
LPETNGSAKLLAEALASRGFVTLRYDKVASGPHVKENIPKLIGKISMQSHLEELKVAVETTIAEKNVAKDNLFVLTNSEGAIHAVNYQLQAKGNRFKGLVLTGAPGRSVGELGRSQIFDQIKSLTQNKIHKFIL